MSTDREVEKAELRHAQSLAIITFICIGVAVYWLDGLISAMHKGALRDVLNGALYIAAFFAVFTIGPMTDFYYSRISRHRR